MHTNYGLNLFKGILLFQLFLIFGLINFEKCFMVPAKNHEEERIRLEPYYIFVKYDFSSEGRLAAFQQRVDISDLNDTDPTKCHETETDWLCLRWSNLAKFKIEKINHNCDKYKYISRLGKPLRVRFDITNLFLFGGAEQKSQTWPANSQNTDNNPFVSFMGSYLGVLEPFWLVSNGMYLYVDEKTPLFVTQNAQSRIFEIVAKREFPYDGRDITELVYTVCKFNDMKEAFYHAVENFLGKPSDLPNLQKIKYPSWSTLNDYYQDSIFSRHYTRIEYKVTDKKTLTMAQSIIDNHLPTGNLVIDGSWEMSHGSFTINDRQFGNMRETIRQLKKMGLSVSFMIYPDMKECLQLYEASRNGYFVKNEDGSVGEYNTRNFKMTSFVDMTNSAAFQWFLKRLKHLKSNDGVDSFKFYLDDDMPLPQRSIDHLEQDGNPGTWLQEYVKLAFLSSNMSDVSFARRTQNYPLFVRMRVRETEWNSPLGLVSLIPTLLQMNIIGYPFVSSDVIVGPGSTVDPELFIRWLQINVFMPTIQFSYPPWALGEKVLEQTKKYINLRTSFFDKIKQAMENSVKYGTPVNPPIWWIDPLDPQTYQIDSEFLLGEDLLVAPVVERGARSRNIYLPKGYWKDEFSGNDEIFKGPIWLYNYPADLHELPYFSKVVSDNVTEKAPLNITNITHAQLPITPKMKPILYVVNHTSQINQGNHNDESHKSRVIYYMGMVIFTVLLVICWKLKVNKKLQSLYHENLQTSYLNP